MTRQVATDLVDVAVGTHIGWGYDTQDDVARTATAFLGAGLGHGQRVAYIAADPHAADWLDAVDPGGDLRGAGRFLLLDLADFGPLVEPVGPGRAAEKVRELSLAAIDDGHRAMRTFTDPTTALTDAGDVTIAAYLRAEHLVDQACLHLPTTSLCAFGRDRLDTAAVAALACVHNHLTDDGPLFQLTASDHATIALAGSVDGFDAGAFATALHAALGEPVDATVTVAAAGADFVSHHAVLELDRYARRNRVTVTVLDGPRGVDRVVAALDLSTVVTGRT